MTEMTSIATPPPREAGWAGNFHSQHGLAHRVRFQAVPASDALARMEIRAARQLLDADSTSAIIVIMVRQLL